MKVSHLKLNKKNPRQIQDAKFERLKRSINDFPEMMKLRPMVVDAEGVVIGGNMRLRAIRSLGMKDIPDAWVVKADELTPEQRREFIIKDNNSFGEYDWEALANEWDDLPLTEWGVDLPDYTEVPTFKEYDESVADEVQFIECPECNHRFPK